MSTFIVTETVQYEVEAASEEAAIEIIIEADDRDQYFYCCTDRFADRNPTKSELLIEYANSLGIPIIDLKLGDEIKTEDLKGFPTIK